MEYIIEGLTKKEIDIMESSNIEWCPEAMAEAVGMEKGILLRVL